MPRRVGTQLVRLNGWLFSRDRCGQLKTGVCRDPEESARMAIPLLVTNRNSLLLFGLLSLGTNKGQLVKTDLFQHLKDFK